LSTGGGPLFRPRFGSKHTAFGSRGDQSVFSDRTANIRATRPFYRGAPNLPSSAPPLLEQPSVELLSQLVAMLRNGLPPMRGCQARPGIR